MRTILAVGIIYQPPRVLLGLKKEGKMGVGKWNGFGGHIEDGETVEEGIKREVKEESDVTVINMTKVGFMEFEFANEPEKIMEMHIFLIHDFVGQPRETEEMKPMWFDEKDIPYDDMWTVDRFWLPQVLAGKKIRGRALYDDKKLMEIINKEIREVEEV